MDWYFYALTEAINTRGMKDKKMRIRFKLLGFRDREERESQDRHRERQREREYDKREIYYKKGVQR